ncbi:MAG: amidohydrolase family protein [Alphaproteobacteria bacterium]|nr:amidohydrolase family protein [Alphaproteobacteria bacterium]
MNAPLAFINARLLDPASGMDVKGGSLLVVDGRIAAVGGDVRPAKGADVIDCGGHCLAPGLVDMRAFLGEPGFEEKETLATAGLSAAAGGVTTLVSQPQTDPVMDEPALIGFMAERARQTCAVNVVSMAAITKGLRGQEMTEMGLLAEAGAVAFTDGVRAVADAQVMRRALSYATGWNLLVVQHAEEPSLAKGGAMNSGEVASRLGLKGIPAAAEVIMVERDVRLAEMTGGRYHAACLSTGEAIAAMRRAKERGIKATCGVAAHHFALNENEIGEYRTFAKVTPPLRSESDRAAVVEGLASGVVDVIVSDHSPQDQESKRLPFPAAEFGIAGLQTLLPLTLELVHGGHIKLLDLLAKLTVNPARLLGLDAGTLAKGAPADLVVFDLDTPWKISEAGLRSKSKNTPFDGRPVQGKVLRTVVGGETVFAAA